MTKSRDVATQSGLVLINTTTASAASSVQINNCFTSAYKRYKMIIDMTGGNWVDVQARMTSGGTANTSSLYFFGFTYITHAGGPSRSYTGSTTAMTIGGINDLGGINETLIANPALPKVTQGIFVGSNYGTNYNAMISGGFQHNVATAYDGIYIFPNSGTFTGEIKIYGIKD